MHNIRLGEQERVEYWTTKMEPQPPNIPIQEMINLLLD
jgi:hypothetical protein